MIARGLNERPMREIKRWLKAESADAIQQDATFVKAYLERQRADFGALFEFASVGITIIVALTIASIQIGIALENQVPTWVAGAVLVALALFSWLRTLRIGARLDLVDNVLTAIQENPAPETAALVAQLGRWRLIRRP